MKFAGIVAVWRYNCQGLLNLSGYDTWRDTVMDADVQVKSSVESDVI